MGTPLADPQDVEDLWRPLSDDETTRVFALIGKASSLVRGRVPFIDDRIARYAVDPTDRGALDPDVVATVVATIVKRFISNVDGVTSTTESLGSASLTKAYVLRGDKNSVRGELLVTDADIVSLLPSTTGRAKMGTITTHARLGPRRIGLTDAVSPACGRVSEAVVGFDPYGD